MLSDGTKKKVTKWGYMATKPISAARAAEIAAQKAAVLDSAPVTVLAAIQLDSVISHATLARDEMVRRMSLAERKVWHQWLGIPDRRLSGKQ